MEGKLKISLAVGIITCSIAICCLIISLSSPWYSEGIDYTGAFSSGYVEISTHAFYWNYYCEGNSCGLRDETGIHSWYDSCENCGSQLSLYVSMWVLTLCCTIILSIVWLLNIALIWALSKGYPSKGVSLLLPIMWTLTSIILFITVLVFPVALPSCKQNDGRCNMLSSSRNGDSPCDSFVGGFYWGINTNSGDIFWGPSTGYVFLILSLIVGTFATLFSGYLCYLIRKNNQNNEELEYSAVALDNFSLDQGYVAPGL